MDVRPLLARLGVDAPLRADLPTLFQLHRAWRTRVPYENVDIQLGRPIRLEPEALLDKFGRRRRGGFCFEMNGALALLLRATGFAVDVVEAGVLRATRGDGHGATTSRCSSPSTGIVGSPTPGSATRSSNRSR